MAILTFPIFQAAGGLHTLQSCFESEEVEMEVLEEVGILRGPE